MQTLKIDPEFKDKIPPLTEVEFEQLRDNILADGEVYEPIVVWNGTIIDGHNRWRIIQEHPEIPYKVKEMEFADKWAAFGWMYKKQLGRRNLSDEQKTYLLGKLYEARKQARGGQIPGSRQNDDSIGGRTVQIIAKEQGVGSKTVERAEQFAKGVDALRLVCPEAADKIIGGKANTTKGAVAELKRKSKEEVRKFADGVLAGKELRAETKSPRPQSKEMKEFTEKINSVVKSMENEGKEYTIDDAITDLGSAQDTFFMQVRFVISERENVIKTERGKEELLYFIDTMINDLNELKKEVE